jgi:hypothetical protein
MATFTGKTLTISAEAVTDMRHLTLLIDRACPDQTIAVQFPDRVEDPSVGEFRTALFAGDPVARPNRRITAIFTGVVRSWPDRLPSRILLLKRVDNLNVTD